MYTALDVVGAAESRAAAIVMKDDRARYVPFLERAERFAAARGLIVGGGSAVRLLLQTPADIDAFRYDFYADGGRTQAAARELGDALYEVDPGGLGHYVAVAPVVPGHVYSVSVDGRDMFTVVALPVYRGIRTADVVIPARRPASFSGVELECVGPEIQLIRTYASLCDPGKAGDWGGLLGQEKELRAALQKEIVGKVGAISAGEDDAAFTGGAGPARGDRSRVARRLIADYAAGPGRVLVGNCAVALLEGKTVEKATESEQRVQVVSSEPLEAEAEAIARAAGVPTQWALHDPKIPADTRLRRLTVYATRGRDRGDPLIDVYNAAAHEVVPYTAQRARAAPSLKLGTPFVLMRFRLVDMWAMRIVARLTGAKAQGVKSILTSMLAGYSGAAAVYARADAAGEYASLMPTSSYLGRAVSAEIALKREARHGGRGKRDARPFVSVPYYPARRAAKMTAGDGTKGDESDSEVEDAGEWLL